MKLSTTSINVGLCDLFKPLHINSASIGVNLYICTSTCICILYHYKLVRLSVYHVVREGKPVCSVTEAESGGGGGGGGRDEWVW